ncbi:cysteine--tRNA ligase [Candidatus Bathyarchaeota archaeon]|nr:cysteine--tRNA ligase [Candidatus Bathyarchaeota archaeon]
MKESKNLRFYDTLTRRKRGFKPLKDGKVGMYVCGPTVYSDPHIGNFRSFIVGDLIRRWLEYRKYEVFYVMNITDIDDKTIRDSGREGVSLREFTDRYTRSFLKGIDLLNIKRATVYPKATENILEMIEFIQELIEKGLAYEASDGVYFDIDKFPGYGKLSRIELSAVKPTERVSSDEYGKENPNDFALWKAASDEELERGIFYDSPWGKGRPGWHIECSVMSKKYLGDTIDIHAGGEDLIFPHHENEIAQSEGLTGKTFVRFWMHIGYLMINGRKMSKSLGNYISFDEVLSKYTPNEFRYFYLSTHYRKQIDYTEEAMANAKNASKKLSNTIDLAEEAFKSGLERLEYGKREEEFLNGILGLKSDFEDAMDDDLDTPRALNTLHQMSKLINEYLSKPVNKGVLSEAYEIYRSLLGALGLFEKRTSFEGGLFEELIKVIIETREKLRSEKNYALSDKIRELLSKIGVILSDKPDGTSWTIERR